MRELLALFFSWLGALALGMGIFIATADVTMSLSISAGVVFLFSAFLLGLSATLSLFFDQKKL